MDYITFIQGIEKRCKYRVAQSAINEFVKDMAMDTCGSPIQMDLHEMQRTMGNHVQIEDFDLFSEPGKTIHCMVWISLLLEGKLYGEYFSDALYGWMSAIKHNFRWPGKWHFVMKCQDKEISFTIIKNDHIQDIDTSSLQFLHLRGKNTMRVKTREQVADIIAATNAQLRGRRAGYNLVLEC